MKKFLSGAAAAALLGLGLTAMSAVPTAARVVCNSEGDCWHTDRVYHAPGIRFEVHPDSWYFHNDWDHDTNRHWRGHHEGRGYWHNGVWVTL